MEARLAAYTTVCAPRRAPRLPRATQPQLTGGAKLHSSKGERQVRTLVRGNNKKRNEKAHYSANGHHPTEEKIHHF